MTATAARPAPLRVWVDDIPTTLQAERRWVLWRYVLKNGRWTKVPYQASGATASSNDPATWTTFDKVVTAYRGGGFDGIGFVLGDGWAGIDLDNCVSDYSPTGGSHLVSPAALSFIAALDRTTYLELSPSTEGYKAIGRGQRIGGEIKFTTNPPTVTRWDGARFFAITGHGTTTREPSDLSNRIEEWFPAPPPIQLSSTREGYTLAAESSDDDLLMAAVSSANGDDFVSLWQGDTSAYGGDHSRADMALCGHLAFWTNYDTDRIDRLFRLSGLMRAKWNTASYRRATLGKVMR